MSTDLCFYFQVHQPWRLRPYRFLEIGKRSDYFHDEQNAEIVRRVADRCYLPMNRLLLDLIERHQGRFKVAFSISGTAMGQLEEFAPAALESFRRLFETGCAELVAETHYHSLAALFSPEEFKEQVEIHRETATRLLVRPSRVFRNTELIASPRIARLVRSMGYEGLLIEGAESALQPGAGPVPHRFVGAPGLVGLPRNYVLSDDIAFRFAQGGSSGRLTPEEFVGRIASEGHAFTGLYMDYETFGEHQSAATGILDFMDRLPEVAIAAGLRFVTPSQKLGELRGQPEALPEVRQEEPFSWADTERDLSAWVGNPIQNAALKAVYDLESVMRAQSALLETWRRLLTSDHFYYMCTKYCGDGEVHQYFNPHESPYDAHIIFMNVIEDLSLRTETGSRQALVS